VTITVEAKLIKPKVFDIDELLKLAPLEERIYRFRCVEAVVNGDTVDSFPLAELLKTSRTPQAMLNLSEFISLHDPRTNAGQNPHPHWPYKEGLRIDEAMHPLTLLTVGLYGEVLPNQTAHPFVLSSRGNTAFKSAKSIVKNSFSGKTTRVQLDGSRS